MKGFMRITCTILILFIMGHNIWCSGESEMDIAPMEKSEQEILYSAIQGFVGNWWNGSDLYPDPCGWTPIQGVSCDLFNGLWYVNSITIGPIQDNSFACSSNLEFRSQLFEFKYLKSLSIFNCILSSNQQNPVKIPIDDWEKLAGSLESLEFRSNPYLIGEIPYSFGNLFKLQSLVLIENGLTGKIPANIGNLVNLKRLVLAENCFADEIPERFGGLKELLILDLSRNSLSGSLPNSIGGLNSLLKLDLSNNLLEGKLPIEMKNLKNLTLLDLRSNKFSGGLIQSLQEMNALEELVLSNNPIGGNLMSLNWQKLQNLVILDLSSTNLNGLIPDSLSEFQKLRFLGLNDNKLTGNPSPKLANLPCLSALYINGNNLGGELKYSKWFYRKMGRRFGAWNNPNLCYPVGLMSTSPFGVKSCQQEDSKTN